MAKWGTVYPIQYLMTPPEFYYYSVTSNSQTTLVLNQTTTDLVLNPSINYCGLNNYYNNARYVYG